MKRIKSTGYSATNHLASMQYRAKREGKEKKKKKDIDARQEMQRYMQNKNIAQKPGGLELTISPYRPRPLVVSYAFKTRIWAPSSA